MPAMPCRPAARSRYPSATSRTTQELGRDQLDGPFVAIEFSDTGMGIPPNLLTKIFDPFFTTKEVGKGTGLGLSQVYGFAHQAGGTVRAESKIGQGTTITVYLPASSASEIAVKEPVRPGQHAYRSARRSSSSTTAPRWRR